MTSYPGTLIDDDTRFRILKCYIYKFIKHRVERRPRFDVKRNCFAKKYFWFNTWRPLSGSYHNDNPLKNWKGYGSRSLFWKSRKFILCLNTQKGKSQKKGRATYSNAQAKTLRTTFPV